MAGRCSDDGAWFSTGVSGSKLPCTMPESNTVLQTSKLTSKYQTTIPTSVRKALQLKAGDLVGFEVDGHEVRLRRAAPLDIAFAQALEGTLTEWSGEADERAFKGCEHAVRVFFAACPVRRGRGALPLHGPECNKAPTGTGADSKHFQPGGSAGSFGHDYQRRAVQLAGRLRS